MGRLQVYMLAPSVNSIKEVRREVNEIFHKLNAANEEYQIDMAGQPEIYWKNTFRQHSSREVSWIAFFKNQGWLLFALLLVPAVNLAGLISSRMDKRLPELGLRKAFGASRSSLLQQLLTENLLLTSIGGTLGLIIAYFLVWRGRNWLLTVFETWPDKVPEGVDMFLTPGMLFNPTIILFTFAVCVVLNFFSAVFPALRGMNRDIISSLHDK
ncbi:MAG: FtsX-like permease family protein [Bacteroides sp.]|nr:FtsX-like permease family protein [Bacteroides sp.]